MQAPLTPEQQTERPYALGAMEMVPKLDAKLTKKNELSIFMMIYNEKVDAAKKPDVVGRVQLLCEGCWRREVLHQDARRMSLNAQTLPPEFDAGEITS